MRALLTHAALLTAGLALMACESTASPPASIAPSTTATANSPPTPTASAAKSPAVAATTTACLMTHICGCNLGCARIPVDPTTLREGMRVTAQTGPYAGKEMLVAKETDTTGTSVFALSDRDHTRPCERPSAESRSLMGFACATKDSGPVPAKACAAACE